ncbi:helix-turn-helix domain-containing protein [Halolamina salifodinae]|uniref:Putative DNA binding protein n=1 Tax=Halolamina salifodinae TaxID=1202767 RepID=A0A8T4GWI2_9EURY|nr:helix-turn-helix domain-containing protein [Halolamina salifodinae]MBP1987357.1 putative DNA binding protein [Halolamina salifodinae]
MYRAKIYLRLDANCVLSRVTDEWDISFPVSTEEVIGGDQVRFVLDAGDRIDEIATALSASAEVVDLDRVEEGRLAVTKHACGALPIIRENHGMLQGRDRVSGDQRVFDVVVYRRADLRNMMEELSAISTVRLGRLSPYLEPDSMLSERQSEVVTTALERGYYEWPREVDAETLAEELDIAHSTFLEHLRKAERALLEDALSRGDRSGVPGPDEAAFMRESDPAPGPSRT